MQEQKPLNKKLLLVGAGGLALLLLSRKSQAQVGQPISSLTPRSDWNFEDILVDGWSITGTDLERTNEALEDGNYDPYWTTYTENRYGVDAAFEREFNYDSVVNSESFTTGGGF